MAGTAHTPKAQDTPGSRLIRVFLSSTFRDFMEERDLLVKQVFPELRRKARERGVEVVDVDLRWGITEEESRQGKVIPICLGEIDRCRPYFVGMLGERYGWIPPVDQYSPDVIVRQPWLKGHLGGVSVTELEILHGVLNDKEMAGRAFFYFRDPRWSRYPDAPGYVCETQEEEAKLTDLKQRIRTSGFPVAENIPDPKALAEQIGRDLWELIEQQYPDLDEPDALEREERQHASYRRSRLGVYLGGKRSINQLERWIDAGQQKILITGESGAGKSALIANWIETHQKNHPEDVVYAHHLGCSNDASAIRPLLARLIDTAKQRLPEVFGYSLSVPQDWWELVAKAVEALQSLGRWSQQNNHRWIWVLDGLDRLAPDDQKALPWLPLTVPEGVVIVASALECPARKILLERKFKTRTIAALKANEQDALIQQYLGRYTKQLIAELRQTILSHPLAGSPLFLRVLLEELRQCGRYETLADQLTGYLSAKTIDDLYERVLERLEADTSAENVRKVMTALLASRAGLSEEELLQFTALAQVQWAPIDLALEEGLGRNGNRLVLDHEYLRKAVERRWRHSLNANPRESHRGLYDFFLKRDLADPRTAEEVIFQATKCINDPQVKDEMLSAQTLAALANSADPNLLWNHWLEHREGDKRLDKVIELDANVYIRMLRADDRKADLYTFSLGLAKLLYCGGCYGELLINLSDALCKLTEERGDDHLTRCAFLRDAAHVRRSCGMRREAIRLYQELVDLTNDQSLGSESLWMTSVAHEAIAWCYMAETSFHQALQSIDKAIEILPSPTSFSKEVRLVSLLRYRGQIIRFLGNDEQGIAFQEQSLEKTELLFGRKSINYLNAFNDYVVSIADCWSLVNPVAKANELEIIAHSILSESDPRAWRIAFNCYSIYLEKAEIDGDRSRISNLIPQIKQIYELQNAFHGSDHEHTIQSLRTLGKAYCYLGENSNAFACLRSALRALSDRSSGLTVHRIKCILDMSCILLSTGKNATALGVLGLASENEAAALPPKERIAYEQRKAEILFALGRPGEGALALQAAMERSHDILGPDHISTIDVVISYAESLSEIGELNEAENILRRCLTGREESLGSEHPNTLSVAYHLAELLSSQSRHSEAIRLRRRELTWCRKQNGDTDTGTLTSINELAIDLRETGELEEAEALFRGLVAARQQVLKPEDFQIGRALGGLAKTLEAAGKLEEALTYSQQALDHRLTYEGPNSFWTNCERLDLARVLLNLGRSTNALSLLEQLLMSMKDIIEPDDSDTRLMEEAETLRRALGSSMG